MLLVEHSHAVYLSSWYRESCMSHWHESFSWFTSDYSVLFCHSLNERPGLLCCHFPDWLVLVWLHCLSCQKYLEILFHSESASKMQGQRDRESPFFQDLFSDCFVVDSLSTTDLQLCVFVYLGVFLLFSSKYCTHFLSLNFCLLFLSLIGNVTK